MIKWKGLPVYEATWEAKQLLNQRFPTFHLEDKVNLLGGSIVTPQQKSTQDHVYTRRGKKGSKGIVGNMQGQKGN